MRFTFVGSDIKALEIPRRGIRSAKWGLILCGCIVAAATGCDSAPIGHPTWRLLWQGHGQERYYVDTTTIRVAGDSVEAIAWDVKPQFSGTLRGVPRLRRTREAIVIDCSANTLTGSGVTNTDALNNSIQTGAVAAFGGSADDRGPHRALEQLVCGARGPRDKPQQSHHRP